MPAKKPAASKSPQAPAPAPSASASVVPSLRKAASLTSPAAPPTDYQAAWQQAHDAVQAAFDLGTKVLTTVEDKQRRAPLSAIIDSLSKQLTALNREDMKNRTISLQAASGQLQAGIASLKTLRQQLAQIADTFADAAKVLTAIDGAVSGLKSLLAAFPAL